jgi:hypothetical protein
LCNECKRHSLQSAQESSDALIGPTNRVAFGLEPRRWELGKWALWSAASQGWTGPRTSTTPPSRHVTTVTAQLLRLCRTTRTVTATLTVTVRPSGPSPAGHGPPAAGRSTGMSLSASRPILGHGPPAGGQCPGVPPVSRLIPSNGPQDPNAPESASSEVLL